MNVHKMLKSFVLFSLASKLRRITLAEKLAELAREKAKWEKDNFDESVPLRRQERFQM